METVPIFSYGPLEHYLRRTLKDRRVSGVTLADSDVIDQHTR